MGRRRHELLILSVFILIAAGCSDDDGNEGVGDDDAAAVAPDDTAGSATDPPSDTTDAATTTGAPATTDGPSSTPPTTEAAAAGIWEEVTPGGECACSDGSEFSFWVREASPDKVLFFFQGGGACWSLETCDPGGIAPYKQTATPADDDPTDKDGIWDLDNPQNPLADYSMVYVPYCTGDVHLGNTVNEYSEDVSIHHRGYVNGTAALDHLVETFPDASSFVVAGESAGSIPSPMYAGLVSDHYPNADITVLADGSGGYPDDPVLNAPIGEAWGVENAVPEWEVNEGVTLEEWSIPSLFVQAGLHDSGITFARHDFANDEVQRTFLDLTGRPVDDLPAMMITNEERIEADTGLEQHSYTSPGENHTLLSQDTFYTQEAGGVALVDWVTDLIDGTPVDDVR